MCGTVINRIKMEKCISCGSYYISKILREHVAKRVGAPEEAFDRSLCPECKRIAHAAGIVGEKPDYIKARTDTSETK